MKSFKIADTSIGEGSEVFIIAELSANHNGSLENALSTVKAAKEVGADAIKLQTYTPDTITIDCRNEYFKINDGTIWDGMYLHDLYKGAYTPYEWHEKLFTMAKDEGLICFSSPFDSTAVDLLESLKTPAYKIASFEIFDIPLIREVASKGKPVIISTGIATKSDIDLAIKTIRETGNDQISVLKCTSSYPALIEEANLATMLAYVDDYNVIPGLSDHTLGITVPSTATALGAKIIEKHFIIDKNIGGPDASFSLDINEFKAMVKSVRDTEKAIGKIQYDLSAKVQKNKKFARSLFVVAEIEQGETFTIENLRSIRPGYGLPPKEMDLVLGKRATRNIEKGTPLNWDLVER